MLNRNQITEKDFKSENNYLQMTEKTTKIIVQEFDNRMKKTIHHRQLNRDVSYQYLIRLEIYKLIKHIIGDKKYEGFRIWW